MALLTKAFLHEKMQKKSGFVAESNIRNFSAAILARETVTANASLREYDIFLSHSSEDAIYIQALHDELTEAGFAVYVDWIEDPQMDRSKVSKATAAVLRERMKRCRSLLYATSQSAKKSVWMPWELGYMDARTKSRVAVVPIVDDADAGKDYRGQEYLGLYPYLDKTLTSFYIHESTPEWVGLQNWISGQNPTRH
jgi:hypothetical protein